MFSYVIIFVAAHESRPQFAPGGLSLHMNPIDPVSYPIGFPIPS